MFSGIIKNLGQFNSSTDYMFTFNAPSLICKKIKQGDSIAVNGACLTVYKKGFHSFSAEVMPETFSKTNLGKMEPGDLVNLELPLTLKDFLSGHLLQGHVDETGTVSQIKDIENSKILTISVSKKLSKFIVEKGSIALNGVSLTVISSNNNNFTVGIIPYTLSNTNFKNLTLGDFVNIEVDILAKYIGSLHDKF